MTITALLYITIGLNTLVLLLFILSDYGKGRINSDLVGALAEDFRRIQMRFDEVDEQLSYIVSNGDVYKIERILKAEFPDWKRWKNGIAARERPSELKARDRYVPVKNHFVRRNKKKIAKANC